MASPAAATGLDAKKMQASFEHLQAREAAMREKEEELAKLVRPPLSPLGVCCRLRRPP
jgi:hypothetical protein